jgi:hypothetical protein
MKMKICILIILVSIAGVNIFCKAKTYPSGGPYYFKSWQSYQIPFKPVGMITLEEGKKLDAYYEAFFDDDGKTLSFAKYLYGKFKFKVTYSYRQNGVLEESSIEDSLGKITLQKFDTKGNPIKE